MDDGQYTSFRPTAEEGWRFALAGLGTFVPGAALLTQLFEYAYKRRDLIYDRAGCHARRTHPSSRCR